MLVGIEFNVMQNMIVNSEFRQLWEIIENTNGSVVTHRAMIVFLKDGCNSCFLPYSREVQLSQTQVKYMFKDRNKNY
jgi:hypothetical protein